MVVTQKDQVVTGETAVFDTKTNLMVPVSSIVIVATTCPRAAATSAGTDQNSLTRFASFVAGDAVEVAAVEGTGPK